MNSKQSDPYSWGRPHVEPVPEDAATPHIPGPDEHDPRVKDLFDNQPNTIVDPPMTDDDVKEIFETVAPETVPHPAKKKKH